MEDTEEDAPHILTGCKSSNTHQRSGGKKRMCISYHNLDPCDILTCVLDFTFFLRAMTFKLLWRVHRTITKEEGKLCQWQLNHVFVMLANKG